ncbi:hypothetical protein GCM10009844_07450 [Nocardioides koreensis]|uniref:Lytic transglycosylase domain-containing protein n=1 Tax=Nocardioides koreensis TaxID=433651 RepID=A0ABN2Z9T7_9ACTN
MPPARPSTMRARATVALLYAVLTFVQLVGFVKLVVPVLGFDDPAAASPPRETSASAPRADAARGGAPEQVDEAKKAGCTMAGTARRATREADIPYYVGCAFLQQETDGGRNVFGHDPTVFAGAGEVTRSKYLAYKSVRQRTGEMQGVGPMQLTWSTYQDQADRLGGAWKPYPNMLVGFRHLADLHRSSGSWTAAAHDYNGSGPMADAYAAQMADRFDHMRSALS